MKSEYINPFVTSTTSVFETMLGCQVTRMGLELKSGSQPDLEVSGVIGLSAKASGVVVLSLCREAALGVTEAMLGARPASVDADVIDAVGEVVNMIAGGAKAQLEQYATSMGIPSVIVGKNHVISFPSQVTPFSILFDCPLGQLRIEVGLIEQPVEPAAVTDKAAALTKQLRQG